LKDSERHETEKRKRKGEATNSEIIEEKVTP